MLRDSLLEQNHRSTFSSSWLRIVPAFSMVGPWAIAVVSSAKCIRSNEVHILCMLFMQMRNKKAPQKEPWGTSRFTFRVSESELFMDTC